MKENINNSNQTPIKSIYLIEEIIRLIKEGDKLISLDTDNSIIVCGDTGAGKSTLINYLTGEKLVALKPVNSKKLYLDTNTPTLKAKIGHLQTSETQIPNKIHDETLKLTYWDCPGFEDSRGAVCDISNAFYINKLFNSQKLKTMIVVDEASINGSKRGKVFKDLVLRLSELFVNKEDLYKSVVLVFTKIRDIENFREELQKMIVEIKDQITEAQLEVLAKITLDAPIATFDLPLTLGEISDSQKSNIVENIEKAEFISKPEVKITIAVDSLLVLQDLVLEINKQISSLVKDITYKLSLHVDKLDQEELEIIKVSLEKLNNVFKGGAEGAQEQFELIENITKLILKNDISNQEEIIGSIAEIKLYGEYFQNFFSKIIPNCGIDLSKLKESFFLKLDHEIDFAISKIVHKNNQEKLNIALIKLEEDRNSYDIKMKQQDEAFNLYKIQKEQEMFHITEQLKNANQTRTDFDDIIKQTLESNNKAVESLGIQMLGLTNQFIELGNKPTEIHYHTTNVYEDDGGCVIS